MANTIGTVTIEDFDGEITTTTVNLQNIDATGSNYASVAQDLDEIKDSILTVIRGEVRKVSLSKDFPESLSSVSDNEAQRETKWLVTMRDSLQFLDILNAVPNPGYLKLFTFTIGTADLTHLLPNLDSMDLSQAPGSAMAGSFNSNVRSPWNNNPEIGVVPTQDVVSVVHVGRAT